MAAEKGKKTIASNKKAFHDFFIEETYECGIELVGTEVTGLAEKTRQAFISVISGLRTIKAQELNMS